MKENSIIENYQITSNELNILRGILEDYHGADYTVGRVDIEELERLMTKLGCTFESKLN